MLKTYISKHSSLREEFKKETQKRFHDDFLDVLNKRYYFWAIFSKSRNSEDVNKFVDDNFKTLVGRIFKPNESANYVLLALERESIGLSEGRLNFSDTKDGCEAIYNAVEEAVANNKIDIYNVLVQDFLPSDSLAKDLQNERLKGWNLDEFSYPK